MTSCFQCGATTGLRETGALTRTRYPDRTHICNTCAVKNLENGLGFKMLSVGDGCEWDPSTNKPATVGSAHSVTTPATLIVGAQGNWRLCEECAALPRFRRYRVRKTIVKKGPTP